MDAGERYASIALRDLPRIDEDGDPTWLPVRVPLGIGAFGVNAFSAERPGDPVIEEHDESDTRHEELYVVLSGRAEFAIAGDALDAPAGTLVFVRDPDVRRVARATEPGTTVLAVGGARGAAFEPSDWELRGTAALGR